MPVFAFESAMACLSAEISANNQLFIQEDQKKAWVLNEELYEKRKFLRFLLKISSIQHKTCETEISVKFCNITFPNYHCLCVFRQIGDRSKIIL